MGVRSLNAGVKAMASPRGGHSGKWSGEPAGAGVANAAGGQADDQAGNGALATGMPGDGVADIGAAVRQAVTRVTLTDFRSYRHTRIEAGADSVVLTGPNGAGKTNLLEALSFLAPGRGLRRARISDVERLRRNPATEQGGPGWAVAAEILTPDGERKVGTGRDPEAGSEESDRRVVRIDGAPARTQTSLADLLQLLWLTPDMDRLFVEPATQRRRFLDRLTYGFAPTHVTRLSAYERAMRERTRLLKEGRLDDAWLGGLEKQMAENGVAVAAARCDTVDRLAQAVDLGISAFPVPALAIEGSVETTVAAGPALAAEDWLRDNLAGNRRTDAEAGRAMIGPHRSDLVARHRAKDMPAALCSTGEQKALLVAIILAHARLMKLARGAAPVLLLDEIAAHLDETRRAALFDEIGALGAQAWMTGTDPDLFSALTGRARFLTVADGAVVETTKDQNDE